MDLMTHYRTQHTGIVCGDESATLTGVTLDGQPIEGFDTIPHGGVPRNEATIDLDEGSGPARHASEGRTRQHPIGGRPPEARACQVVVLVVGQLVYCVHYVSTVHVMSPIHTMHGF